jgi:hypothetical protein
MMLAQALFELSMLDGGEFTPSVHRLTADSATGTEPRLNEVAARYGWLTTAFLYLVALASTTFISGSIIAKIHGPRRLIAILMVGATLCLVLELSRLGGALNGGAMRRGIFEFTYRALPAELGERFLSAVWSIVNTINVLSYVVPVLAVLAGCSCVAPLPPGRAVDLPHLALRMRHLKTALTTSSVLLAAGVLHMAAWLLWPAALVVGEDAAAELRTVALSISTFWGVVFSIMALVAFVPSVSLLRGQAEQLVAQIITSPREQREWLQEHGFMLTRLQNVREFATLLAPMLAVPIGELLGKLIG